MDYIRLQNRYISAGVTGKYRIDSTEQLLKIYGYDFKSEIEGLSKLTKEEQEFVIQGMFSLMNSSGLLYRESLLVTKVEKYGDRYKLHTSEGYSLLYRDGSIG